jgi:hypothetical protein
MEMLPGEVEGSIRCSAHKGCVDDMLDSSIDSRIYKGVVLLKSL